jgi:hypothetical protein
MRDKKFTQKAKNKQATATESAYQRIDQHICNMVCPDPDLWQSARVLSTRDMPKHLRSHVPEAKLVMPTGRPSGLVATDKFVCIVNCRYLQILILAANQHMHAI